jgi:hypothetical protein
VVLLIDEVDRAEQEFEAFLLEVLSDFQVSVPELGTLRARHTPLVVLTSNNVRELSDALKRRCLHLYFDYPSAERELEIVKLRAPEAKAALAEAAVALGASGRRVANVVINAPDVSTLSPAHLAELIALEETGVISKNVARQVLDKVLAGEGAPSEIVEREGLGDQSDEGELEALVHSVVAANPDEVAAYREGDDVKRKKLRGFLMGQLMKQTQGKANPGRTQELLAARLKSMKE